MTDITAEALVQSLPKKVVVKELLTSRYDELYSEGILKKGERPARWENRKEGVDVVRTEEGVELTLQSDGQQSPPQAGWTLMLNGGDVAQGFTWTLYGIA